MADETPPARGSTTTLEAAVLDVDGTLLDSVYHHTVAWGRAFAALGLDVPLWRVHRTIGMGGDKLVAQVAGDDVEERLGDLLRTRWEQEFDAIVTDPSLLAGAAELLAALREAGLRVTLASSANPRHAQRAFSLLDATRTVELTTTADDAERSKPDPDLVDIVLDRLGTRAAFMVGDAVWDVHAATAAGIPTVGVCTGGYSRGELVDAGAVRVVDSLDELREDLPAVLAACEQWLAAVA